MEAEEGEESVAEPKARAEESNYVATDASTGVRLALVLSDST